MAGICDLKRGKGEKRKSENKRALSKERNWTCVEREAFAEILSDVDEEYATKLEQMALKKSANTEVYEEIGKALEKMFESEEFQERNAKWTVGKGFDPLDLSVKKLREQYSTMKKTWKKIHDEPLKKSGIAAREVHIIIIVIFMKIW